ncbi:GDSL esterase/lipase [Hibiscus syriacus]|uniref:GDSL esterase/lipase n=1 Tax=Hibiscus syriacus TaxID=106335 RepID=A0A6A3D3M7_HIBSY|nr:GDSL esterase/lipase [Hibiscus syriacus]
MEENKVKRQEKPASERQVFCLSGPTHLTAVDWNNFNHRRSVAASLVQGVYILEHDRQQNRQDSQALAPPWWDSFDFQLIRPLVDDVDNSIFGAIYELKPFTSKCNYSAQNAPDYVIAFRGTINKSDTMSRDLKLDIQCVRNRLHESSRYHLAMQAVQSIIDVAAAKGHHRSLQPDGPFTLLCKWVPYLFVNPADPICSGYIGYFKHRKKMEEIQAGKIERIATLNSLLKSDSEPLHLILSANLTINLSKSPDFKRAHGIHQWWDPSFDGQSELYEYK